MTNATLNCGIQDVDSKTKQLKIDKLTKIAVLAGGISGEKEVSLRSGKNVIAALKRLGYQNAFLFEIQADADNSQTVIQSLIKLAELKSNQGIDIAFLVTHGTYGEDGCLQGALELMGIQYIGSDVVASANCMDKLFAKDILNANDLPTLPAWYESLPEEKTLQSYFQNIFASFDDDEEFDEDDEYEDEDDEYEDDEFEDDDDEYDDDDDFEDDEDYDDDEEEFEYEENSTGSDLYSKILKGPFIAKLRSSGSSVGVTKLESLSAYEDDNAFANAHPDCFLEPFVSGTEVTASILELRPSFLNSSNPLANKIKNIIDSAKLKQIFIDDNTISLPLLELRSKKKFYDYEAKYTPGMTEFVLPAELDEETTNTIHELAVDAFNALGCRGFARVDFIIPKEESCFHGPQILELNTLPGFTDTSDMPAQAKAAGLEYDELVEMILLNA